MNQSLYVNKFIFLIIIIICIVLLILLLKYYNHKNTFINPKQANYDNDGNMTFNYLNDTNYTKKILDNYYLNDDTKINGVRVNNHFFQKKFPIGEKYIYGNILSHKEWNPGNWGNYTTFAEYIYHTYGVRR